MKQTEPPLLLRLMAYFLTLSLWAIVAILALAGVIFFLFILYVILRTF